MDFNINQLLETTKYVFESTNFTYETTGWYIDEDDHGHFFGIINLASKTNNERIFSWTIELFLDFEKLWRAYNKIHSEGTAYFKDDFTKNEDFMRGFIERHGLTIVPFLEQFNGTCDRYDEIAKLVDGTDEQKGAYGGMLGKKFGI